MSVAFTVHVATPNVLNGSHRHWSVIARMRKQQREAVSVAWSQHWFGQADWRFRAKQLIGLVAGGGVVIVRLTRLSAGELDPDNLGAALKSVRDQVTEQLGLANDRDPRIEWSYAQDRASPKQGAVRVEVVAK